MKEYCGKKMKRAKDREKEGGRLKLDLTPVILLFVCV